MVKTGTIAAGVGVITALWTTWAHFQTCSGPLAGCPAWQTAPGGTSGTILLVSALALLLVSLGTFVAPASAFFVSAALAILIGGVEAVNYSAVAPGSLAVTMCLAAISAVLGLVAARRRTSVSEQANPMNLPVFG